MQNRLGTIEIGEGQKITFLEEINTEQFECINKCVVEIEQYKANRNLHNIFIYNFIELNEFFQSSVDRLIAKQIYSLQNDRKEFENIHIHGNRLFLNFLSSFRTLTDHTNTYLSRKLGKDSEELNQFVAHTNTLYDSHFEYRFMCKLRNYSQHCGLPISGLTYNLKNEGNARNAILNAVFNRDELLAKFDWGREVTKDLLLQPEKFPVMWTAGIFYKLVEEIFALVDNIEILNLKPAIDYIDEIYKTIKRENCDMCVFYNFEMSNPNSYENSKFGILTMPYDLIDEIKSKYINVIIKHE